MTQSSPRLPSKRTAEGNEAAHLAFQSGDCDAVVFTTTTKSTSLLRGELPGGQKPLSPVVHDMRHSAIQLQHIEGRCHGDGERAAICYASAEDTVEGRIAATVVARMAAMDRMAADDTSMADEIARVIADCDPQSRAAACLDEQGSSPGSAHRSRWRKASSDAGAYSGSSERHRRQNAFIVSHPTLDLLGCEAQTASETLEAPMGAYLIADVHITDPATYEEYKRQVSPLIARFGGRYAARGGQHEVLEGDWEPHRLVVLEFPDMASLKAWYDSPEYGPIKAVRESAATSRLIALEGLDTRSTLGRSDQQAADVIDRVQISLDNN